MKILNRFRTSLLVIILSLVILPNRTPANASPAADENPAGAYPSIVFAAIGDYGDDSAAAQDVSDLVRSWKVDFVITLGDNRYEDRTYDRTVGGHYCSFLAAVEVATNCAGGKAAVNAFFPAPGNHDYYDGKGGGINEYLAYFTLPGAGITTSGTSGTELYYDFIQGPVHFFTIDSEAASNNPASLAAQKTWLETQLKASTTPWQIVYFHHPPYSSGFHGSNLFMQWDFKAWGADAVLSGHDHTYERIVVDDMLYFVNGLGGKSLYTWGPKVPGSKYRYNINYGAMRVFASANTLNFQFINRSPRVVDGWVIFKESTPTFLPAILHKK